MANNAWLQNGETNFGLPQFVPIRQPKWSFSWKPRENESRFRD